MMDYSNTINSTYRIQFSPYFTFRDASLLSSYLKHLGISHVYASPVMEAVPGSAHGYDVTDFSMIREELGGESDLMVCVREFSEEGIGWIQDFVPNHMAMDTRNPYLWDVLEKGQESRFAKLFDIDWDHRGFPHSKLCLPILERPYLGELSDGKFSFALGRKPVLRYNGQEFPISEKSYELLLGPDLSKDAQRLLWGNEKGKVVRQGPEFENERSRLTDLLNERMKFVSNDGEAVHEVISRQNYQLRYWPTSANEINYRRFFAVNGLICLREEDRDVFNFVHSKILSLLKSGSMQGVRIDHIDGLFDPREYLRKLKEQSHGTYIVVEKILEEREMLNEEWQAEGTSGYDFLSQVTSLACSNENALRLDIIYGNFSGMEFEESGTVHSTKLNIIDTLFPAVLDTLTVSFMKEMKNKAYGVDLTFAGLRQAIREILSNTPVYRTYITMRKGPETEISIFRSIINHSRSTAPELGLELDAIEMFMGRYSKGEEPLKALQQIQQYMPAVLAKSVEDTIFYRYSRLISLNEVGMNPFRHNHSPSEFHMFNLKRMEKHPLSMNALSTHDTKISEDIRARINVISEVPEEWETIIWQMHDNNPFLQELERNGSSISRNEEYYIYELLLGSFPIFQGEFGSYRERLLGHVTKALRESGANTGWDHPVMEYEQNVEKFIDSLLESRLKGGFANKFWSLHDVVSFHGFLNSISQKILQLTSPGVPDTYQGTEIWCLNFVDPDNRRQVDFHRMSSLLEEIMEESLENHGIVKSYLRNYQDGKIKLLVTSQLLNLRNSFPNLFLKGSYSPMSTKGVFSDNVVAFSRKDGSKTILVAVPRLTVAMGRQKLPVGNELWGDTSLAIPESISGTFEDVFNKRLFKLSPGQEIKAGELFESTPFSVLVSK